MRDAARRLPYRRGRASSRATTAIIFTSSRRARRSSRARRPLNRDGLKLAELGVGETFGEEALISDGKRNATITMQTDGALDAGSARTTSSELLNEPLLHWVDLTHARELIEQGAKWLDVRLPSEFENAPPR